MNYTKNITYYISGNKITYTLTRKSVKNINLRIKPDGSINVSAPKNVSSAVLNNFIKKKYNFILSAQKYFETKRANTITHPVIKNNAKIKILNNVYVIKLIEDDVNSITEQNNVLIVSIKNNERIEEISEKLYGSWLKQTAEKIFNDLAQIIFKRIKNKYAIDYPAKIKAREMKSRWGSCNVQTKVITINTKLLYSNFDCINYVIAHELSHLIIPNHSSDFYKTLQSIMPEWKSHKKTLDAYLLI